MTTHDEQTKLNALVTAIADREYKRGLESGLNVARTGVTWLRMISTGKNKGHVYTFEDLATMIEARITEEEKRAGI